MSAQSAEFRDQHDVIHLGGETVVRGSTGPAPDQPASLLPDPLQLQFPAG